MKLVCPRGKVLHTRIYVLKKTQHFLGREEENARPGHGRLTRFAITRFGNASCAQTLSKEANLCYDDDGGDGLLAKISAEIQIYTQTHRMHKNVYIYIDRIHRGKSTDGPPRVLLLVNNVR